MSFLSPRPPGRRLGKWFDAANPGTWTQLSYGEIRKQQPYPQQSAGRLTLPASKLGFEMRPMGLLRTWPNRITRGLSSQPLHEFAFAMHTVAALESNPVLFVTDSRAGRSEWSH